MSPSDSQRFHELIAARTGMTFGSRRHGTMARGVASAARKQGCGSLETYYRFLKEVPTDHQLWEALIDEITVCETYFFRDTAQFAALRRHILPELISRHRNDRRIRLWSAGCASGEEPYSLSILMDELLGGAHGWHIHILATDINRRVLESARQGLYRQWSFRQTDPAIRSRYFTPQGNRYAIRPRVKDRVAFAPLNLCAEGYPSLITDTNAMDLILFRNVAIYQSGSVIGAVVEKFHHCLVDGGWLMVAASEVGIPVFGRFTPCHLPGTTAYRKAALPPAPSDSAAARLVMPPCGEEDKRVSNGFQAELPSRNPAACNRDDLRPDSSQEPPDESASSENDNRETLYIRGMTLLGQKDYPAAMGAFQSCIAADGSFAPGFLQMARIRANAGQLDPARRLCHQALEHDPLLVEAHYALALILMEMGSDDAAAVRLKKTLFLDPDLVLGHFSLSVLFGRTGAKIKAERHRRQAVRLASRQPPEAVLPGSDDLTAGQLLAMARNVR